MDEQNPASPTDEQTAADPSRSDQPTDDQPTVDQLTVDQLSEGQLLARIFPRLRASASALIGPGDDAAVLTAPAGRVV
ncbi:MAG: hypothetical protein L0G87_08860, partial [Renibacterium salmoninarum]|nr:hypothetical protein [Renibacterium salmoninarum]